MEQPADGRQPERNPEDMKQRMVASLTELNERLGEHFIIDVPTADRNQLLIFNAGPPDTIEDEIAAFGVHPKLGPVSIKGDLGAKVTEVIGWLEADPRKKPSDVDLSSISGAVDSNFTRISEKSLKPWETQLLKAFNNALEKRAQEKSEIEILPKALDAIEKLGEGLTIAGIQELPETPPPISQQVPIDVPAFTPPSTPDITPTATDTATLREAPSSAPGSPQRPDGTT